VPLRKLGASCAFAAAALALAAAASAAPVIGVTEDATKYGSDGGASLFRKMRDSGLASNRIAVFWDASRTDIFEKPFLDRTIPQATAAGIQVVLSVYPLRAGTANASPAATGRFCGYMALLARTYPQVTTFIVGNEPNQPRFWQPQFDATGQPAAGAQYETLLATCYDALKAVNPGIDVIGLGLSNRGNDNPTAADNVSTSPIRFIHDVGAAYRASGRTAPIMDELSFHCYPNVNTDPLEKHYLWPNAGCADLDRVKQAVWDAFAGTGQPTFAEAGTPTTGRPLTIVIDEVGWQVGVGGPGYYGQENVPVVDESTQARIYAGVVQLAECDPSISTVHFFHLLDEADLDRFQSGLFRLNGTPRASAESVRAAAAAGCTTGPVAWTHSTRVAGAELKSVAGKWRVKAEEDATWSAAVYRIGGGRRLSARAAVASATGRVSAYRSAPVVLPRRLRPGRYVRVVRLRATANPGRTTVLVGKRFRILAGR
jgi:hypothetical protein